MKAIKQMAELAETENLPKLKKLTLKNLDLTDEHLSTLQASRPGVEIVR